MKYSYGTNDSYSEKRGRTTTAKQLASIIKRDVEYGKWNEYDGGEANSTTACCKYKRPSFVYHQRLFIYGLEREFKELENLISEIIPTKPRKF